VGTDEQADGWAAEKKRTGEQASRYLRLLCLRSSLAVEEGEGEQCGPSAAQRGGGKRRRGFGMRVCDEPTAGRYDEQQGEWPPAMKLCVCAQCGLPFLTSVDGLMGENDSRDDKAARWARLCFLILGRS
jgi:hypothetical protein